MSKLLTIVASFVVLTLASCASTPPAGPPDLRGTWAYQLIDTNANTWDQGVLTVEGGASSGTWERTDYYGTVDHGSWTSDGKRFQLTGPVRAEGVLSSSPNLDGTWSVDSGDHGKLVLNRKS